MDQRNTHQKRLSFASDSELLRNVRDRLEIDDDYAQTETKRDTERERLGERKREIWDGEGLIVYGIDCVGMVPNSLCRK